MEVVGVTHAHAVEPIADANLRGDGALDHRAQRRMHIGGGNSVAFGRDLIDQDRLLGIAEHDAIEDVDHAGNFAQLIGDAARGVAIEA